MFLEKLLEWAARRGQSRAFSDPSRSITYGELPDMMRGVAYTVSQLSNGKPVAVLCGRNAITPVIFLGVLLSGGCYVPLDPDAPADKITSIVADSGVDLIINASDRAFEADSFGFTGTVAEAEDCIACSGTYEPKILSSAEKTAYIVYTSGSTGKPKGVVKSIGSIDAFLNAYCQTFDFTEHEVIGNQTPFFFDASAKDIFLSVFIGGEVVVIPTELFMFPVKLIEYLNDCKVSMISWVPSALIIVAKLNTFEEILPKYLKKVFFVGEVLPVKYLRTWYTALPDTEFVNLYGSSEIMGVCCYYRVSEKDLDITVLPIGQALETFDVFLAEDGNASLASEKSGEICVAGHALADEYLNDEQLTNEKFKIVNRNGSLVRVLFTGDLGFYREDGMIVFSSRKDFQIKHLGHRIELGEIESAAASIPGVYRCCCYYDKEKDLIILVYSSSENLSVKDLRSTLKNKLSSYMFPNKVIQLDALPINPNGKIDRVALKNQLSDGLN